MAKSWCKVSAGLDSHPRIRRAGNLGRQVFEFALRRNAELDKNGVIPAEHMDPEYLADVLMFSKEDAVTGVSACVRTRLLASDGENYVICGWDDEWGKHPMTEAERKRVSRAKSRNQSDVTKCPDTIVTKSDGPECHRSEERREEEKREESGPSGPQLQLSPDRDPDPGPDSDPSAEDSASTKRTKREQLAVELATTACEEINRLRGSDYQPDSNATLALCKALAKAKHTSDEVRAVVQSKRGWIGDSTMHDRFVPSTLLARANFEKYLDDIRANKTSARQATLAIRIASGSDDDEPYFGGFHAAPGAAS